MNKINQIVPISEMKLKQPEVLGMLNTGPVVLANRSRPAAVLVSVEQWDSLVGQIEDMHARRKDETAAGRTLTDQEWNLVKQGRDVRQRGGQTISHEDLKTQMQERLRHVADRV